MEFEVVKHFVKFRDRVYNIGDSITREEILEEFEGNTRRAKRVFRSLQQLGRIRLVREHDDHNRSR